MLIYLLNFILSLTSVHASYGGFLDIKQQYKYDSSVQSNGQQGRTKLYYENKLSDSSFIKLEGRTEFDSTTVNINRDVGSAERKDLFDLYLGETFFRYKTSNVILQIGYQELVWGESFGFNSADFITPKNLNFTFLNEAEDARRPVPLLHTKYIGENFAIQLLYGAKAEYSKNYPIDLFFRPLFLREKISLNKDKNEWFEKHEGGGRFSTTLSGFDLAIFGYTYLDRNPVYEIQSYTANTSVVIKELHHRMQSYGTSFSTTLGEFVLRGDYVRHNSKKINYVNGAGNLAIHESIEDMGSLGLDTPAYSGFSFFFISSYSKLLDPVKNGFRSSEQIILSLKVQKEFDSENKFEIVGFSELEQKSNGLQAAYIKALGENLELTFGAETYFGDKSGAASRLKKYNSVFVKLKNFFNF